MARIPAPKDIGGVYCSYASGNGALQFVHCDSGGRATTEPVPPDVAGQLVPAGWKLTAHNGQLEAYQPVKRWSPDTLLMDNEPYQHHIEVRGDGWTRYGFTYQREGKTCQLLNVNITGALRYFLDNEHHLREATT